MKDLKLFITIPLTKNTEDPAYNAKTMTVEELSNLITKFPKETAVYFMSEDCIIYTV